jgi:hypothetical protein
MKILSAISMTNPLREGVGVDVDVNVNRSDKTKPLDAAMFRGHAGTAKFKPRLSGRAG